MVSVKMSLVLFVLAWCGAARIDRSCGKVPLRVGKGAKGGGRYSCLQLGLRIQRQGVGGKPRREVGLRKVEEG